MECIYTQSELEQLCKEWQGVIGLVDWDIKVAIARENDMFQKGTQAGVSWVLRKKTAVIKILDTIDYKVSGCIMWDQDMETSLVHELIHLHMAPFDDFDSQTLQDICLDQACDLIAKGLVSLKRRSISCVI